MATLFWIETLLTGSNTNKTWTRKELQEKIYETLGIDPSHVVPTFRDRNDMVFTEDHLRKMGIDEFYSYFTDDPELMDDDEPKSSFKEANKKMKTFEKKDTITRMDAVTKGLTYENYLKSVTPKSSFKEANKTMRKIEDESNK